MPNTTPKPPPSAEAPESWRLDRKVPITAVLLLAGNLVCGVWYASQTNTQLAHHDRRLVVLEARSSEQGRALQAILLKLRERLARIEAGLREQSARTGRN